MEKWDEERAYIGLTVRGLREERSMTQRELARELGLSQTRLSQIEHGRASLTAEQLLAVLRSFNASISDFTKAPRIQDHQLALLQNALARAGARSLRLDERVLVDETYDRIEAVVAAGLRSNSPRLVLALGSVVVQRAREISFPRVASDLEVTQQDQRLYWLLENLLDALPRTTRYRYVRGVLERGLAFGEHLAAERRDELDFFERVYRDKDAAEAALGRGSSISRKWRIVTALRPSDFEAAVKDDAEN